VVPLYLAVTSTATIFAAATGIVGSSITLLGVMAAPTMRESKYDVRLSAGCITAGGTLGILIPPSIMLVVMGPVVGVPVTDLFAAAILPGLLLATLYISYALIRCRINPDLGPPLPEELRPQSFVWVLKEMLLGVVPVSVLILATLGSIIAGMATPHRRGCCWCLWFSDPDLGLPAPDLEGLKQSMFRTLSISAMILLLVAASSFFGSVFSRLGSASMLTNLLLDMNLSPTLMIIAVMILIFILGWPLEWVPIVLIFVPILMPLVREMGFNLVWFCILVAVTLQTAWLSPPVALSAYFLKAVVPNWDLKDIYIGMMQFMVLQMLGLFIIMFFPIIVTWLPEYLSR